MADLTPDEEADIRDSVGRGLTCTADTAAVLAALDAVRAREARLVAAAGMTEDDTERLIEAADAALTAAIRWRAPDFVPEFAALAAHTRALRADLARVTEERDAALRATAVRTLRSAANRADGSQYTAEHEAELMRRRADAIEAGREEAP